MSFNHDPCSGQIFDGYLRGSCHWYVYKGYINLVTSISYIGREKYRLEDAEGNLQCEEVPLELLNSSAWRGDPSFPLPRLRSLGPTMRLACRKGETNGVPPCTHPQNKHDTRVYK